MLGFPNTKSQLALSSSLVQSSGSRCYRAPIVQEVGNLPSVARLRASNEVRYVVAVAPPRAPSLAWADSAAAATAAAAATTGGARLSEKVSGCKVVDWAR